MTGLAFLHGWGYGPCVWEAWSTAFPGRSAVILDAGYFGPRRMELPANADGWVGIGHSFGFAQLLGLDIPWRGLVGFGAFVRFCASAERPDGTPTALLDAMLSRLDTDPADVLRRFTKRCGQPAASSDLMGVQAEAAGLSRLRADLRLLRGLDLPAPKAVPPVLLLHAADDRIVPPALAQEARDVLRGAQLLSFGSGGHALPFTRTEDCLPVVREFIDALR
jgi:pimeloyl-[acyl-carrier protein] methyl ester esterase